MTMHVPKIMTLKKKKKLPHRKHEARVMRLVFINFLLEKVWLQLLLKKTKYGYIFWNNHWISYFLYS